MTDLRGSTILRLRIKMLMTRSGAFNLRGQIPSLEMYANWILCSTSTKCTPFSMRFSLRVKLRRRRKVSS